MTAQDAPIASAEPTEEVFTPGGVEASSSNPADEEEPGSGVSSRHTKSILAACKDYFDRKEFHYTIDQPSGEEERYLIKAGIGGENGSYNLVVDIKEAPRNLVIVYVLSSLKFPRAHRLKLCEYITRANYSLVLGNFELDMNDGEVRYKCSAAVGPEGMSFAVLDRMMPAAMSTMDRYYENMVKVSYGIMEPKDGVDQIENASSSAQSAALESMLASVVSSDEDTSGSTDASQSADGNLPGMLSRLAAALGGDGEAAQ